MIKKKTSKRFDELDDLLSQAEELIKKEDYKSALVLYDRIEMKCPEPLMGKVKALWALGNLKEASESYKRFIYAYPYDDMIKEFASFVVDFSIKKPLKFYTCFISYSSEDEKLAEALYKDLSNSGINCWKWNHDAKIGKPLWSEITDNVRNHDKVILIASQSSLNSPAVNREIERAIQLEDDRCRRMQKGKYKGDINVLVPIRIDNYILRGWENARKPDVINRFIGDAINWQSNKKKYQSLLDRLVKNLKRG